MLSVDAIEALADSLTPSMKHVLERCSEAGFWGQEETGCWREWRDVVYDRAHVSFYGTVQALERRGLIQIKRAPGFPAMVALTREGLRVRAALRLRELDVKAITKGG